MKVLLFSEKTAVLEKVTVALTVSQFDIVFIEKLSEALIAIEQESFAAVLVDLQHEDSRALLSVLATRNTNTKMIVMLLLKLKTQYEDIAFARTIFSEEFYYTPPSFNPKELPLYLQYLVLSCQKRDGGG